MNLKVGNRVSKITGDYTFEGVVVAVFKKIGGEKERIVVENAQGILHIFSPSNVVRAE